VPYDSAIHKRRSTRLCHHDYGSPGYYFVTICTHQKQYLFGEIQAGCMGLNQAGQIAQAHWRRLAQHFAHIRLDAFVVMPNHIHGIIEIVDFPETSDTGATLPTSTSGRGEALSPGDRRQSSSKTLAKKSMVSFSAAMNTSISSRVL
jgi:putative transposase